MGAVAEMGATTLTVPSLRAIKVMKTPAFSATPAVMK